jgi:hypothetical protein
VAIWSYLVFALLAGAMLPIQFGINAQLAEGSAGRFAPRSSRSASADAHDFHSRSAGHAAFVLVLSLAWSAAIVLTRSPALHTVAASWLAGGRNRERLSEPLRLRP